MAPAAPFGRKRAIAAVRHRELPIHFGSPHPHVAILEQDGKLRVRGLVVDPADADAASKRALAGGGAWMPEHYYALGKPTGEIFAEADTAGELIACLRAMSWPDDW
jgi:hypothetical protein